MLLQMVLHQYRSPVDCVLAPRSYGKNAGVHMPISLPGLFKSLLTSLGRGKQPDKATSRCGEGATRVHNVQHYLLQIDTSSQEPVHTEELENGNLQLLYSPGFIRGIAAGDEFRIVGPEGEFEVVKRYGNVAVQVYADHPVEPYKKELEIAVQSMRGTLDGSIEKGMVFTIPISAGFDSIENLFDDFVKSRSGIEWYYGNVYDPHDGVTPLNWWV